MTQKCLGPVLFESWAGGEKKAQFSELGMSKEMVGTKIKTKCLNSSLSFVNNFNSNFQKFYFFNFF